MMDNIVIDGEVSLGRTIEGDASVNLQMDGEVGQVIRYTESNYEHLERKPQIEGVTLVGDKAFEDLGLEQLTAEDIDEIMRH